MVVTLNDSQSHFGACESVFGVVKFPVTLLGAPTLFGAPHSAHIVASWTGGNDHVNDWVRNGELRRAS